MNILDLFAGSGGFSLGFESAGLSTKHAVELDKFACETLQNNFQDTQVYCKDVCSMTDSFIKKEFKKTDIIIGGPPCQGFSVAGPSQYGIKDSRNKLVFEMHRFTEILKPQVCIIENVPGLIRATTKNSILEDLVNRFAKTGYKANINLLDSKYFGVPQSRKRAFIIFSKENLVDIPFKKDEKFISVYEAISDLDFPELPESEIPIDYRSKSQNKYQRLMRKNSRAIFNHVPMKHTKRLIERFKTIETGQSLKDVSAEHGQRGRGTNKIDIKKRFKMNNQRLDPDKFSLAIAASFQSNFIHPFQHRNLTAREGARLMSYPDKFVFSGPRTLMSKSLLQKEGRELEIGLSQYNQIGNSVPPELAKRIADALIKNGIIR
jgi:DNA (cytosine-5)-methyltransferase 1